MMSKFLSTRNQGAAMTNKVVMDDTIEKIGTSKTIEVIGINKIGKVDMIIVEKTEIQFEMSMKTE